MNDPVLGGPPDPAEPLRTFHFPPHQIHPVPNAIPEL
jgi:hypothetical protein